MNWAIFWGAVSAIFTGLTAVIAVWAMLRWRKQEELKVKLNFKIAIADYSFQLTQMPITLNDPQISLASAEAAKKLNELLAACNNAWMICEGLLEDNKKVKESWNFIFDNNQMFFKGVIDSRPLGRACMAILMEKFVFD